MLKGEKELIGNGNIRDVYLVNYNGKEMVVKALRDDYGMRVSTSRAEKIHRWEAAALDAVSVPFIAICAATSTYNLTPPP